MCMWVQTWAQVREWVTRYVTVTSLFPTDYCTSSVTKKLGMTSCTMRQLHAQHINHVHNASTTCTMHRLHAQHVNPTYDASPTCTMRQPHARCMVCVHYMCMTHCSHDRLCVPFCVATVSMPPASACVSVRACTCVCVCLRAYVSVCVCMQVCLRLRVHLVTY